MAKVWGGPGEMLEPKLVTVLREGYSRGQLGRDVLAGVIVGVVALPLAIAFGIASGVTPQQGLVTAIIAGFLISALGGSRVQIGGPTGAFIVIVYGVVQRHGVDGLALATIMAGVLLMIMGFARLGSVIKFVPFPVTLGFTSGIAIIIAVSQLRDVLGLTITDLPAALPEKVMVLSRHLDSVNPAALGLGTFTVVVVAVWSRVSRRVPGSLVAIVIATVFVHLAHLDVETIGSRFGAFSAALPSPRIPVVTWETLRALSSPALSIALLAAIESLLSAVVADGMLGTQHRSNTELVALGLANLVAPLFGGIPATGAIARTATNVKNGGRSPIAGMVHAVTLLIIVLFFGRWAALIPIAALGGILLYVAWSMSEWRAFMGMFRAPRGDLIVMLATFLLTIFIDLTVAIQVGVVLAAFLFMRRMAAVAEIGYVTSALRESSDADPMAIAARVVPEGVEVFEIYGAFFFGAASKFRAALRRVEKAPRVFILRLREVPTIDATGLQALEELRRRNAASGTVMLLSGVGPQLRATLQRAGFVALVGEDNILPEIDAALARARVLLADAP